jgi:ATP-binding protein involved in chromosome partitioning
MDDTNSGAQKTGASDGDDIRNTLSRIKNTIVVMSGKGGVGKTTVAANLAIGLADRGDKVGLMDIDIHGPNVPKMLGIEDENLTSGEFGIIPIKAHENLSVMSMAHLIRDKDAAVIWRGPMKIAAIKQFLGDVEWGDLDYLVIDLPPGTGDEPLSIAQQIPGAHAVIVTTPQDVALLDSRRSVNFARQLGMNVLGIVENMAGLECPHCGENIDLFKKGGGELAASDLNVPFLGRLPIEPSIVRSGDSGIPFIIGHPTSASALSFNDIIDSMICNLEQERPEVTADQGPAGGPAGKGNHPEHGQQEDHGGQCGGCGHGGSCGHD